MTESHTPPPMAPLSNKTCHFALLHDDGVTVGAICDLIRNHQMMGIDHHLVTVGVEAVNAGNPFGLLKTKTEDVESGDGQCAKAQNTRHLWQSLGIGAQSVEVFRCVHCKQRMYD